MVLSRLLGIQKKAESLKPLCNLGEIAGYNFESDTVRVNLFSGFNEPHVHLDESGMGFFLTGSPEVYIRDEVKPVDPGEMIVFGIKEVHGFRREGKAVFFHGYVPFKKADNYEIKSARYHPHPNGGDSILVDYSVNGVDQETLSYGPDSRMTLGAVLRILDYHVRKARGEKVNEPVG